MAGGRKQITKLTGVTAAAVTSVSLLTLPTPAVAGAAEPSVVPNPATVFMASMLPWTMKDELKGALCQTGNRCVALSYPALWYPAGVPILDRRIDSTPGQKIVVGYSQGAQLVTEWLRKHANDPDAPSADDLAFVLLANGNRAYGGANAKIGVALPQTQYRVVDIVRQYDGAGDMPDNMWNLLALANALAGFFVLHADYERVDVTSPANIVWTEGKTTYVFVPTRDLPLLAPLRWIGLRKLADALNSRLKPIVEKAYRRDYPVTGPPNIEAVAAPAATAARLVSTADTQIVFADGPDSAAATHQTTQLEPAEDATPSPMPREQDDDSGAAEDTTDPLTDSAGTGATSGLQPPEDPDPEDEDGLQQDDVALSSDDETDQTSPGGETGGVDTSDNASGASGEAPGPSNSPAAANTPGPDSADG